MELSEEEIIKLYNMFRNMELADINVSVYTECNSQEQILICLKQKIKNYVEKKGFEWMVGKKIKPWW